MSEHIVPVRTYVLIFTALMVLTVVTVAVSFVDLGDWSVVVALAIACTKAVLVILFFMHVKYSSRLTWAVVVAGFFWFGILIALTMNDYLFRNWLTYPSP